MASPTRFERVAYGLGNRCSILLSYEDGVVLGAGLEPARPFGQWILNPRRLPIPPPERVLPRRGGGVTPDGGCDAAGGWSLQLRSEDRR